MSGVRDYCYINLGYTQRDSGSIKYPFIVNVLNQEEMCSPNGILLMVHGVVIKTVNIRVVNGQKMCIITEMHSKKLLILNKIIFLSFSALTS